MVRKKVRRTTTKKKASPKRKPIGFVKTGSKYKLVFGTKTKPRLSKKSFSKKSTLKKEASKYF